MDIKKRKPNTCTGGLEEPGEESRVVLLCRSDGSVYIHRVMMGELGVGFQVKVKLVVLVGRVPPVCACDVTVSVKPCEDSCWTGTKDQT